MVFDRGSAVVVEVEFKKQPPFGTADYFDPVSPTITIKDPAGSPKVTDAPLVNSSVGKFYYICQTAAGWAAGAYSGEVTAGDGTYTDMTINPEVFKLR